ncbi:MAG TPA: FAD-dependent oxidoreductase [Polyangia bacterium]|nr:FAD-dependent oxidoreductase [Polyangia bacterium]
MRVAILGGGACGTTAAWHLARAGVDVTVVEREPRVGGLCGTEERDGFRFDFGGHRFISKSRALEGLVRELVGEDLLLRTRSSAVLHRGRRYRYPLELDDVVRNAGLVDGSRALLSYGRQRLTPARADVSFEDWVVQRFGRRLYDAFFGPYTHKLWGIPPTQISADWAAQRISLPSLGDVALRLAGLRSGGARTYARRYWYPRFGIGQIFERMAAVAERHGAQFRLGARVTGVERGRDGNVRAVQFHGPRGDEELRCDAAISTLSLPLFARMLGGASLPADVARAAGHLRFRAIRLMHFLLDRPEFSPHTWLYVSEPHYRIARIQEPRRRSPDMAPPGRTSLMLELPCDVGDELWRASDDDVAARCLDELRALGFGDVARDLRGYYSSYVEEGYPIYHLDYQRERERVLAWTAETPNAISVGRQGAFRYVFMDTAMEMGVAAAEHLLGRAGATPPSELDAAGGLIEARALTA